MAMTEEERQDFYEMQEHIALNFGEIGIITEVMALTLSLLAEDAAMRARLLDFLEGAIVRSQAALSETDDAGVQFAQGGSMRVLNLFVNVLKKGISLPL